MPAMRGLILDISDVDEKTITLGKINYLKSVYVANKAF